MELSGCACTGVRDLDIVAIRSDGVAIIDVVWPLLRVAERRDTVRPSETVVLDDRVAKDTVVSEGEFAVVSLKVWETTAETVPDTGNDLVAADDAVSLPVEDTAVSVGGRFADDVVRVAEDFDGDVALLVGDAAAEMVPDADDDTVAVDDTVTEVEGDAVERLREGDNVPDRETLAEGDTVAAGTEAD